MRKLDYYKRFTYIPNEVYEHLKGLEDAAGGDVDLVILPAMTGTPATGPALEPTVSEANDDYVATVTMQITNKAKTKVMEWFNGTLEVKVDITSTSGTIAINDGTQGGDATFNLDFENGIGKFTITMGGTWEEGDTVKITVDDSNIGIMGYTVEKNNHFLIEVTANPAG